LQTPSSQQETASKTAKIGLIACRISIVNVLSTAERPSAPSRFSKYEYYDLRPFSSPSPSTKRLLPLLEHLHALWRQDY
ncbi:MAG: hypothetical protein AAF614_31240, partial [Chloroflexota bacterium]